jgi:hypothetical protein
LVNVAAFVERRDGGFVAVWCEALLEVVERLRETNGLDVACERDGLLGGVVCGVDLAALRRHD